MMSMSPRPSRHLPLTSAVLLLALLAPAVAQASGPSPYAGQKDVDATGLLPAEVEALEEGKGMAQALPAEVNDYPGPLHVLEEADAGSLGLEPEQRREVEGIHGRMNARAVAKGREVLDAEAELARRFRHRHIDAAVLEELVERIARLRGELRLIHLQAHLETRAVLTSEQRAAYRVLRGYDEAGAHSHHHLHP